MQRTIARPILTCACALMLALTACGGTTYSTTTPTSLSWEGESYTGEYETTFEGLSAGDPISVDYEISSGSATIELSHNGEAPYVWTEVHAKSSEITFIAEGGDWTAKITLQGATGSVEVEVEDFAEDGIIGADIADPSDAMDDGNTQLSNPFQVATTLDELANMAGFEVNFPDQLTDIGQPSLMQAIPGELAQVVYGEGDDTVLIRKGIGESVFGDYNTYDYTTAIDVDGVEVTLSGDDAEDIAEATWSANDFQYSISTDKDMSPDEIAMLVSTIS